MSGEAGEQSHIERLVTEVFSLVSEAIAGATAALLGGETSAAQRIVDADRAIDNMTDEATQLVWRQIDSLPPGDPRLRQFVRLLLILPELERSGDLVESIARRAANNLGPQMSPASRGFVERMSEVALEMWGAVAVAYQENSAVHVAIDESDEEVDILHSRLTLEVESGSMPVDVASEVTLVARFYERLGDHAVNLARRIAASP